MRGISSFLQVDQLQQQAMDAGSQAESASGDLEKVLATREKALRTAQVSGLAQVFFAPAGHSCSVAMHFMRGSLVTSPVPAGNA